MYLKGVRFRIYPNREQRHLIAQTFGCARLVYNTALAARKAAFESGTKLNYNGTSKMLTEMKTIPEYAFLNDVDSVALQQSLRDLDTAYNRFFKKKSGYPKFKSKHNHLKSYRTMNNNNHIYFVSKYLKLPKLGRVKIKQTMNVGKIHSVTVEQTPSGKYYAVLLTEFEPEPKSNKGGVIGIDVGLKEFYTDSNGNTVDNPKFLEKSTRKLIREQRRLTRKQTHSCNYEKQRIKVARINEHIANQRKDFLQKQSTALVRENQTICVENLNIKGMTKNHRLARAISSVSWSEFFRMLEYKALWYGCTVIKVSTFYPSSQTCHVCGHQNPITKNLSVRSWTCHVCGTRHDRDENAAINILNKGLSMLK